MLAGVLAPGRVTHAKQVKGEKPDKDSVAQPLLLAGSWVSLARVDILICVGLGIS